MNWQRTLFCIWTVRLRKKIINVSLEGNSVTVQGVRHVIYEMLYNIADNAIRYTNQNGTVNIFTGTVNGHAFYRVEDNGIGIPEMNRREFFELFYRVDKAFRATGGTGLGLSIVKHGAILHNAEIKLKSEPGKGTKKWSWCSAKKNTGSIL